MGRKYYRKSYRGSRDKYSVEQNGGSLVLGATGNGGVTVVPPATTQGMRKVKHLTLNMANVANTSAASTSLYWALVYVPQGTNANTLFLTYYLLTPLRITGVYPWCSTSLLFYKTPAPCSSA